VKGYLSNINLLFQVGKRIKKNGQWYEIVDRGATQIIQHNYAIVTFKVRKVSGEIGDRSKGAKKYV